MFFQKNSKLAFCPQKKTKTLVKTTFIAFKKSFKARIKSLAQNVSYTILFQYQKIPATSHLHFGQYCKINISKMPIININHLFLKIKKC